MIIHSIPRGGEDTLYLRVFHDGTANVATGDGDLHQVCQFPEVPQIVRAVWRAKKEILLLSPDGRIHLYDFRSGKSYQGPLDLPLCCDLQITAYRPVYVTID